MLKHLWKWTRTFVLYLLIVSMVAGILPSVAVLAQEPGGETGETGQSQEIVSDGMNVKKSVTPNPDGTFDIRLDILGKSVPTTTKAAANVIVVMDVTQSMTNNMPGTSTSRMEAAKSALRTLIGVLNPGTGDDLVSP